MQVTESRVFALSASGRVYVISAQAPPGVPMRSSTSIMSRWGTGWLWGGDDQPGVQHFEIVPAQKLTWGER